ncbi:MAG TPA: hypothetical protein VGJ96_09080 [Gemmatimonadaceae bacterium]
MSSARAHAAGGAPFPRGANEVNARGIRALTTGATTAGGADVVQPIPVGQDGQEGDVPSGAVQQSTPPTVVDPALIAGACIGAGAEAWCTSAIA